MTTATASVVDVRQSDIALGRGRTARVYEAGSVGLPTLLLIHGAEPGITGDANWAPLMAELGDRFHCIAPDVPGFGDSSHPDPAPIGLAAGVESRAAALLELVDAMDVDELTVVGNSMGGVIALRLAALLPDRVRTLVLLGTGGMPGQSPSPAMVTIVGFYQDPTPARMAELISACSFATSPLTLAGLAEQRTSVALRAEVRRSFLGTFASPGPLEVTVEQLASLRQPTVVIHGREDSVVPVEAGFYLSGNISDADLYLVPHCGHSPQLEHPLPVATVIADFIDRHQLPAEGSQR